MSIIEPYGLFFLYFIKSAYKYKENPRILERALSYFGKNANLMTKKIGERALLEEKI